MFAPYLPRNVFYAVPPQCHWCEEHGPLAPGCPASPWRANPRPSGAFRAPLMVRAAVSPWPPARGLAAALWVVALASAPPGLARRPAPGSLRPLRLRLRLRGGGGVFEGQLSEAHGLGRVSETMLMRERIGANCGDPPNVPPDITSHHHLDTLSPQHLFESIGTDAALTPSGELTPEWEEQGRNFLKAHVARGAAMMAEMGGASLHLSRALHAKFDADGDGYMQRADLEALLAATEPAAHEVAGGAEKITIDAWQQILNDTGSDPAKGLTAPALLWLYSQPGEDLRKDCWTVFGNEGMAHIPHYNPLFDIFPDPNMFRATPDDASPAPTADADNPPGGRGGREGALEPPKLRRWCLEEGSLPANHDLWDDKSLPELMPVRQKSDSIFHQTYPDNSLNQP